MNDIYKKEFLFHQGKHAGLQPQSKEVQTPVMLLYSLLD